MKLIKLFKDGCDPCTQMTSFINEQSIEVSESFNIMENINVAEKYSIMSVPVLILLDNEGNEVDRTIGYKPHEIIKLASQL